MVETSKKYAYCPWRGCDKLAQATARFKSRKNYFVKCYLLVNGIYWVYLIFIGYLVHTESTPLVK